MGGITVDRSDEVLLPDPSRVVARAFVPGEMNFGGPPGRLEQIVERLLHLPLADVANQVRQAKQLFAGRHSDLEEIWQSHMELAVSRYGPMGDLEPERAQLIGAYFTQEYAFEAAALTNPSMVPHPVQPGDGALRFVMSLRAVGEGHISSIEFRTGVLDATGRIKIDPIGRSVHRGYKRPVRYQKQHFIAKLRELAAENEIAHGILGPLPDTFGVEELDQALAALRRSETGKVVAYETSRLIHLLASSNYELTFDPDLDLSERLIMPSGPIDSEGMEDARWVRFEDDDGTITYYATYTAFDGFQILPQLISTRDFEHFRISTLSGACAQNKGMAIFPRRVDGLYTALSRHDQESIFVLRSDDVRRWDSAEVVYRPEAAWEAAQVGNCGSPLETEEGWLVITHGVGPMRRYVLGAMLLDLHDPTKVLGRLREPFLQPEPWERDGYVPNVVYSCGGLIHQGRLVLPYGFADRGTSFVSVPLDELLGAMD